MVVSPSCGTNEDVCEDTVVNGGHWTITKRGEGERDNYCKDTSGGIGETCWFSSNRT
jgi:hypothetical protein